MAKLPQVSLSSGEVSPAIYGRVDLARYMTALRTCRNFIVRPTGGVSNRPGTEFIDEFAQNSRIIPFIFSVEQAYVLEFGDQTINVYANGGRVPTSTSINISALNFHLHSTPPVYYYLTIETASPHGLGVGDTVVLSGITGSGVYAVLNGTWSVYSIVSATEFRIDATFYEIPGSVTTLGSMSVAVEIASPYSIADVDDLSWTQSADVLFLVHPNYPPYEFRRLSATSFTMTEMTLEDGPFMEINSDETLFVHCSGYVGTVTLTATESIFTADQVGSLFYLEQRDSSEIPRWEPSKRIAEGAVENCFGKYCFSDEKRYKCVTSQIAGAGAEIWTGTIRPNHDRGIAPDGSGEAIKSSAVRAGVDWEYIDSGYGIFRITGYTSGTQVTALVLKRPPDSVIGGTTTAAGPWTMTGDGVDTTLSVVGATSSVSSQFEVTFDGDIQPPDSYVVDSVTDILTFSVAPGSGVAVSAKQLNLNRRSDLWAFGSWSEVNGYPTEVEFYADRLCFAATDSEPHTLWMSEVGNYNHFIPSRPTVDSDMVSSTINARQVNKIVDLIPLDSLLLLTKGSEWLVTGGVDDVITPSSIGIKPFSFDGAKNLPSAIVSDSAVYVQERGSQVRDLSVNSAGGYATSELSVTAAHLLERHELIDMAYQALPYRTVWFVRDDGMLISLSYLKEHEVVGWGRHDLGDGGLVRRVCCVPGPDEDELYLVVERTVGGVQRFYLEKLSNRLFQSIEDAIFMDSALSYDGRNSSATTMTLTGSGWTVSDSLTLTASAGFFTAENVDSQVVFGYGSDSPLRLKIIGYTSSTVVTVIPMRDVEVGYQATAQSSWAFAPSTLSSLDHLEGKTLVALVDGSVQRDLTVSAGTVELETPGVVIHAGVGYYSDLETLDMVIPGGQPIRDRTKSIPKVSLVVQESRGIFAGPDADHLMEFVQRNLENYDEPTELLTGLAEIYVETEWSKDGRVFIRQSDPLPLTVLTITPEVKAGGSG